jgi:four helix bundle protein
MRNKEAMDVPAPYNVTEALPSSRSPCDLVKRTKQYALRIIRLYGSLPSTNPEQILGKQLLRCGTSVGAHYREALRARSPAEFISKIEGAQQELEESTYWLELLIEAGIVSADRLVPLLSESGELMSILVSSAKTAKKNRTEKSR